MGKHNETMSCEWQILFGCLVFALINEVGGQSSDPVPITIVTGAIEKNAVCIDGTPAGYHFDPGFGDGVNNWVVHLMGGGWCGHYTCFLRIGKFHGSTKDIEPLPFKGHGVLSSNQTANPDFYNWNRVFVRYCDGASFLGDVEADDNGHTVQLRGSRIFSAVMDELLQLKGMNKADNVMLSGSSAGGLAVLLNCDRFQALLPNAKRLKCVADSGFFIRAKDLPNPYFRERTFASLIKLRNLTDLLPKSCTSKMNASLCFFPEYFVDDIKTPLFILNSVFDTYQVKGLVPEESDLADWNTKCVNDSSNNLPLPRASTCTPPQMQLINDFRGAFLNTINGLADVPSRGLYIDACYTHVFMEADSTWSETLRKLENKTVSQAVGDWYFDRSPIKLIDSQTDAPLNCDSTKYGKL